MKTLLGDSMANLIKRKRHEENRRDYLIREAILCLIDGMDPSTPTLVIYLDGELEDFDFPDEDNPAPVYPDEKVAMMDLYEALLLFVSDGRHEEDNYIELLAMIEVFGGQDKLAQALGVTKQTINGMYSKQRTVSDKTVNKMRKLIRYKLK